jgi:hypothetical protein
LLSLPLLWLEEAASSFLARSMKAVATCRRWILPVAVLLEGSGKKQADKMLDQPSDEHEEQVEKSMTRQGRRRVGALRDRLDNEEADGDLEVSKLGSELLLQLLRLELSGGFGNNGCIEIIERDRSARKRTGGKKIDEARSTAVALKMDGSIVPRKELTSPNNLSILGVGDSEADGLADAFEGEHSRIDFERGDLLASSVDEP